MAETKKFLDQKGIEYLWSKLSMEDYPNNETLMAVINAIDETKADKSEIDDLKFKVGDVPVSEQIDTAIAEIPQPDWSQTDETAPDYIKNKPTEYDALNLLIEMELISPIVTASNEILLDKSGNLFTL